MPACQSGEGSSMRAMLFLALMFLSSTPALAQDEATENYGSVYFKCTITSGRTVVVITATNSTPPDKTCTAECFVTQSDGTPSPAPLSCTTAVPNGAQDMVFCASDGLPNLGSPPYSNPLFSRRPTCTP